jgi:hypothetical protein
VPRDGYLLEAEQAGELCLLEGRRPGVEGQESVHPGPPGVREGHVRPTAQSFQGVQGDNDVRLLDLQGRPAQAEPGRHRHLGVVRGLVATGEHVDSGQVFPEPPGQPPCFLNPADADTLELDKRGDGVGQQVADGRLQPGLADEDGVLNGGGGLWGSGSRTSLIPKSG